ncbi:hypothetical protein AB3239_11355 [Bacillus subtilis]|uniref:hypothetical protein n=1 Tax=Bacillus subtilis TaxID=1423 RepID=UPI0035260A56
MAMEVYVQNNKIYFYTDKPEVNALGITDYTDDLWLKIKSKKWNIRYGRRDKKKKMKLHPYIYTKIKGKQIDLHRFIMEYWYGKDELEKATKEGYVVDHLNNKGLDCQISNLCFIPRVLNTSKGNDYDIRRKFIRPLMAINITKDFDTQLFQITIAFNEPATLYNYGKIIPVSKIFFLYERFRRALNDANCIIDDIHEEKIFNIEKLRHIDFEYEIIKYLHFPAGQIEPTFVLRDNGELLLNKDTSKILFNEAAPSQKLYKRNKNKQKEH